MTQNLTHCFSELQNKLQVVDFGERGRNRTFNLLIKRNLQFAPSVASRVSKTKDIHQT